MDLNQEADNNPYQMLSPGRATKQVDPDIREMDTGKILHTDIKKYLDIDAHVTDIHTQEGIKEKKKVLQFKYSQHMNTEYGSRYMKSQSAKK